MFKIVIVDAMSAIRVRLEQKFEPPLMMVRGIVNEALMPGRMTIWVWDGANGNAARRAIYPRYKNRPPAPTKTYMQLDLLRELLTYVPAWQARIDGFEGDDVIAALVDHFKPQGHPIQIMTGDGDLSALAGPGVTTGKMIDGVPPEQVRLYKLCVGDTSDTIPGIKGFGKGSWEKADKAVLAQLLDRTTPLTAADEAAATAAGLSKASFNWLSTQDGIDELNVMRRIIAPLPMTADQLASSLVQGRDNPEARDALMRRFLL